jgi:TM2 domain-containing membrane protein YozV
LSITRPRIDHAYLFWGLSLIGIAGLHRLYARRPLSGVLYLLTLGFFGIGTIIDLFTLPRMVHQAQQEMWEELLVHMYSPEDTQPAIRWSCNISWLQRHREIEQHIITLAREHHGIVSVITLSERAEVSLRRARGYLDRMVVRGFALATPTMEGTVMYHLPELLDAAGKRILEGNPA